MNRVYLMFILVGGLLLSAWIYASVRDSQCVVLRRISTDNGVIELVAPDCFEGLPHTTDGNTIRMTEDVWNSGRREEILVHERVHLDQKRRPEAWTAFYKTEWDYDLSATSPPGLVASLRLNPDTAATPYATWRSRYVFFTEQALDGRIRGAPTRVWDRQRRAYCDPPSEWTAFFCGPSGTKCPHQWEHPHELSAEYLTLGSDAPAAQTLRAWQKSLPTS
jgi:hypothetical protein